MAFYLLFLSTSALLLYRFSRAGRAGKRLVLFSLLLFLILTFALHPWTKTSFSLTLLEEGALLVTLLWLALEPVLGWLEKKRREKNAFQLLRNGKGPLSEILSACRMLSEARQGGLIAIQRKDPLAGWIKSGVPLDAQIKKETIFSIFTPPGALHDGGMIIQGDRIAASGVLFPLSKRLDLPTELGTRHRAGLGLSEAADALAIIVSEETGKISFAVGGKLLYDVKSDRLPELLESSLKNRNPKRRFKKPPARIPGSFPEPALR